MRLYAFPEATTTSGHQHYNKPSYKTVANLSSLRALCVQPRAAELPGPTKTLPLFREWQIS